MQEIGYNLADLSNMKYVKVMYTGLDNKPHEVTTDVQLLGEAMIYVYFRYKANFDIKYPQNVTIKFVTDGGMYIAESVLQEIKKSDNFGEISIFENQTIGLFVIQP